MTGTSTTDSRENSSSRTQIAAITSSSRQDHAAAKRSAYGASMPSGGPGGFATGTGTVTGSRRCRRIMPRR